MKDNNQYKPWRLEWTPIQIEHFWDWWGSNPALSKHYFSKRNGNAVLNQISRYIRFSGTVVDLGAGPGYIVDMLLQRGFMTIAIDTSAESLAILEERMKGYANFLGVKTSKIDHVPLNDGEANVVLLIETIEHLGDDVLNSVMKEAYRITKPGGWIAITTPNEENLAELETICPNCGCIYHSYQHLRTWSADILGRYMSAIGFRSVVCQSTLFSHLPLFFRPFHHLAYLILRVKLPHLLYIGQKPEND
jgi:SAM-dependent methyltransferase